MTKVPYSQLIPKSPIPFFSLMIHSCLCESLIDHFICPLGLPGIRAVHKYTSHLPFSLSFFLLYSKLTSFQYSAFLINIYIALYIYIYIFLLLFFEFLHVGKALGIMSWHPLHSWNWLPVLLTLVRQPSWPCSSELWLVSARKSWLSVPAIALAFP